MFDRPDKIEAGYTIADMADQLAYCLEQLKLGPAHIVGVSQGGMIAQQLAINYPSYVDKLVLAVTASQVNPVMEAVVSNWIRLAQNGDSEQLLLNMFEVNYSQKYLKRNNLLIALMAKWLRPKELERFVILARACLTVNCYPYLSNIKAKTLVLGGKEDKVLTGQASVEIAEKLNCQSYIYQDLGHSAYMEAKDFNQRILDFLK